MTPTPRVVVIGGASVNLIIDLDRLPAPRPHSVLAREFHEAVGSTGIGKALNLRRLRAEVTLHAMIGDDRRGAQIREVCAEHGIRLLYDVDPVGTQRHVNLMDPDGRRLSIFLCNGSDDPAIDVGPITAACAGSDLVALNIRHYCRRLIPAVRALGKPIWCDIHDYDGRDPFHRNFIAAADYLFMSSERMSDYRPFMERVMADGKQLVVCTHGRRGATALTPGGEWIDTPIAAGYPVRDTNGAGDAFFAGFVHGHQRGHDPRRCMRLATLSAGMCVTSPELFARELSPERLEAEYARHYR